MRSVFTSAVVVLIAVYPLLIFAGARVGTRATGLLILTALISGLFWKPRAGAGPGSPKLLLIVAAMGILAVLSLVSNEPRFLRAGPALVNLTLLVSFGRSLTVGRMPIAERFARMRRPDLPPERIEYCRVVTKLWFSFFLLNGAICLWLALFASIVAWAWYTGTVAYAVMGGLFAGEYMVRRLRFR